jgi:hypothetical protein
MNDHFPGGGWEKVSIIHSLPNGDFGVPSTARTSNLLQDLIVNHTMEAMLARADEVVR